MRVIGVITARSGSKSLPGKNIKQLGKIPLLGWITKSASSSNKINELIISTDSSEYYEIAKTFNENIIFHKRDPDLAEDVPSEFILLDVIKKFQELFDGEDIIILLQPTTPFITSQDIDECITKLIRNPEQNTCVSVKQISEYPEWMITIKNNNLGICNMKSETSVRQNLEKRYIMNGGAYAVRKNFLENNKKIIGDEPILIHEMSKISSIDIDDEEDFKICQALISSGFIK